MSARILFLAVLGVALGNSALAASPEYMVEDCRNNAQIFFQDFQARTEPKYQGQRVDGTHAVNVTIYLETRSERVQCSYNPAGDTLVGFIAEGKSQPTFVQGGGSPHVSGRTSGSRYSDAAAYAAPTGAGNDGQYSYRCTLKVKNEAAPSDMGCDFSQRQGFVRIHLEDGAEYALEPVGDAPGNFRDTVRGVPVYRKSGLGAKGVIFEFPTETISIHY